MRQVRRIEIHLIYQLTKRGGWSILCFIKKAMKKSRHWEELKHRELGELKTSIKVSNCYHFGAVS